MRNRFGDLEQHGWTPVYSLPSLGSYGPQNRSLLSPPLGGHLHHHEGSLHVLAGRALLEEDPEHPDDG